jgi:hypothetical protein
MFRQIEEELIEKELLRQIGELLKFVLITNTDALKYIKDGEKPLLTDGLGPDSMINMF